MKARDASRRVEHRVYWHDLDGNLQRPVYADLQRVKSHGTRRFCCSCGWKIPAGEHLTMRGHPFAPAACEPCASLEEKFRDR